jgi:glycosyltransferase involved in cell wall biosynthesis
LALPVKDKRYAKSTGFSKISKKILILASWYPSKASEVSGIFIQDQAKVLSQAYDVFVLVVNLFGWRDVLKGGFLHRPSAERHFGITVYRQPVFVPPKTFFHLWTWLCVHSAKRIFSRILSDWGKPDIIHAHVVLPNGWIAVRLGIQYSIPVVLTEHSGPFSVHLESGAQRRSVRAILSQVNKLIAVSPALAHEIRRFHGNVSIDIVGNVVRTDFFRPNGHVSHRKPRPITRFLSVALLSKNKGMHYLLEAMKLLVRRGVKAFELYIGGEGPVRLELESLARELGLTGRCYFVGMLSRSEMKQRMQNTDVFVLPSLGETFGVVLAEAMACGKPVIATRCGGPEFVVTPETGVLVDVANPVALADAMERFISGVSAFDSSTIRHSVVKRFGEEAFLRNMTSIYDEL